MLRSLHIQNFKGLKDFSIESLGQVNLIVGKNNVGKSSVLEAIDLYASKFDLLHLMQVLAFRNEDLAAFKSTDNSTTEAEINCLLPLVTGRNCQVFAHEGISVGEIGEELIARLVNKDGARVVLESADGNAKEIAVYLKGNGLRAPYKLNDYPVKLLPSNFTLFENDNLNNAWSEIAMSELEPFVVKALQIIDPRITRFNIIGKDAVPCVNIQNEPKPVRLNSMGDGLNRILRIILALLSCKEGILLIDEIENGLHYTITDKLWEIIFMVADMLNVQVIATTHSNDCVMSFIKANDENGNLIRVEAQNEQFVSTAYDLDEMHYILDRMKKSQTQILDIR